MIVTVNGPLLRLLLALLLTLGASCSGPDEESEDLPETLTQDFDDAEMDRAIAKARAQVAEFLEVLQSGEADMFSVKAPIVDGEHVEHFWITDVRLEDGAFHGLIGNEPGLVGNVEFGQEWTVKPEDLSDWMYVGGDKIHGGFTIDPLLDGYPPEEAEAMRARLVR